MTNYATFVAVRDYQWHSRAEYDSDIYRRFHRGVRPWSPLKLTFEQELFLTIARCKSPMFNWHRDLESQKDYLQRYFLCGSNFYLYELRALFELPGFENSTSDIAEVFHNFNGLEIVLDATEVFTQQHSGSTGRKAAWSNYKNHITVQFLVCMSPNLAVTYCSRAWGGRTSDTHPALHSTELLEALAQGEGKSIMWDRGFGTTMVTQQLNALGVKSIMPAFKGRGRSQMTAEEIVESEDCSTARVRIERLIQRIKTFHIFDAEIHLAMHDIIDQVIMVWAYLTNFQLPIIRGKLPWARLLYLHNASHLQHKIQVHVDCYEPCWELS